MCTNNSGRATVPNWNRSLKLSSLVKEILAFRDERDWAQFHTPKNIAAALAIEAAELQELMLWKSEEEVADLVDSNQGNGDLSDEIADVLIYALLFCEAVEVDPLVAIRIKLKKNAKKYPVPVIK
jgi:NTP pyrophosphatase (non-canonical NTP hydrolase)